VAVVPDPIRGGDDVLVMCDVLDEAHVPHATNTRAPVRLGWRGA
jgi:glutamine synthetase